MNKVTKTKLKFVTTLKVRHSKGGIRSICNRLAMEHFDKLTCRPDDNVLYVGCGSGDETVILATRVKTIVGIDVDPSILKIAVSDFPADNVEYMLDDLGDSSPNFTKWRGCFSKVVSIDRVMFFPNVPTVVKNMVDCLNAGGELLCIIPNDDFNFFGGGAKVIEDHPEWGQRAKERSTTLWHRTEEQTKNFFEDICEWSQLSCNKQRFDFSLSEEKAKSIWLDGVDYVDRVGASHQQECLEAMWQWAREEYGCNEDGSLKKASEFMVVHGVKQV